MTKVLESFKDSVFKLLGEQTPMVICIFLGMIAGVVVTFVAIWFAKCFLKTEKSTQNDLRKSVDRAHKKELKSLDKLIKEKDHRLSECHGILTNFKNIYKNIRNSLIDDTNCTCEEAKCKLKNKISNVMQSEEVTI